MLRARLLTAAVAIPLLILLIFAAPGVLFAVVVGSIAVLGVAEYAVMAFPAQVGERAMAVAVGSLVAIAALSGVPAALAGALVAAIVSGMFWIIARREDFERGLTDLGTMLVGALFVGLLLPHFVWLRALDDGPAWVTFVLTVAMAGDSGGYFVGRALGRRKLIPRISPGKTVEGSIGILAASLVGGALAKLVLGHLAGWEVGWREVLVLSPLLGILGQLGDLSESVIKRTFKVKESGWIFPGHGGVLDRTDSLLLPVSFVYYYTLLSR